MTSWLRNLKKADLQDLAEEAGLKVASSVKKDDLASLLDEHLKKNASSLSSNSNLADYYTRTSPVKKEPKETPTAPGADTEKPAKPRQRKVPKEGDAEGEKSARKSLSSATPKAVQRVAAKVPLPASPREVSDLVERQTSQLTRRVSALVKKSGLDEHLTASREYLSTVSAIHVLFFLLEAWGLQSETLPWKPAFTYTVPFAKSLGVDSPRWATYPNFFVLLEESFWAPTLLWLFISLLVPLGFGWAFNLTRQHGVSNRRAYSVDPVAFNVSKALLAWLVHGRGLRFGIFGDRTQARVETAMPTGSYNGILIETAIGALAGLYEAVLKK